MQSNNISNSQNIKIVLIIYVKQKRYLIFLCNVYIPVLYTHYFSNFTEHAKNSDFSVKAASPAKLSYIFYI